MSQPTSYTRQYSFTDWQTTHPSDPLPGDEVDGALNAVKATLDGTLANLALIQRDDGSLQNKLVGIDTLSTEARALLVSGANFKGDWTTGVSYTVGQSVLQARVSYICAKAHTAGVFATDYAAGRWVEVLPTAGDIVVNATDVVYDPGSSSLAAEDVQAALDELAAEKADVAGLGGAAVLDVGTAPGTVAAGDHGHSGVYEPIDGSLVRAPSGVLPALNGANLTSLPSAGIPGEIRMYAGATAPTGWSLCDGGALNRTSEATLFAVIGTTFGGGDGSTTFNKPDMRGRAPIGVGTGSTLTARARGDKVGTETHTLNTTEVPSHRHFIATNGSSTGDPSPYYGIAYTSYRDAMPDFMTGYTGGGGAHNNMQPSLAVNFIIKL